MIRDFSSFPKFVGYSAQNYLTEVKSGVILSAETSLGNVLANTPGA